MTHGSDTHPIEGALVRAHVLAALASLVLSGVFGLLVATKFIAPGFLAQDPSLTWGRLRFAHTQGIFFGWLGNAFLGFLYYVVPRLTDRPIASRKLGWAMFWVWQLGILLSGWLAVMTGHSQTLEWAEFPLSVDVVVLIALSSAAIQFATPFLKTRAGELYVSGWYILAALVFTPLAYAVGNVVPEWIPGPGGAAFSGLWTHDAVGLFVTPFALAAAYYVIPANTRRPIFSHALSLIGFWLLAFAYPLNGTHHYLFSPLPMDAQRGAIAASVLLGLNVIVVVANLLLSMRRSAAAVVRSPALRFVWTSVMLYLAVSVQGALQALMPLNRLVHFTDWVVGHSHLAMLGFGSFAAIGAMAHAWQHSQPGRFNERALHWAYWLILAGLLLMVLDLTAAGLVQAQAWSDERPWIQSVLASRPYWIVRWVSGVVLLSGFVALVSAFLGRPGPESRAIRPGADAEMGGSTSVDETRTGVPRAIGTAYTVVFLVGVVFFGLSFVALGWLPALELSRETAATTPAGLAPPSAQERRGREIYAREGCAYCHTQQVRATEEDVRRFGPATAAWETRFDAPHMMGTRRVGPDLSREAGVRPNDWHLTHLFSPQRIEKDSVMPSFPWLFDGSPANPTSDALALVAYLQSLGRDRTSSAQAPGAPHCSCKDVDPSGPRYAISTAPGDVERGSDVFSRRCAGCHGSEGRGDGPAAATLYPQPADLTQAAFTADRLNDVLWNGVPGTAMPRFKELPKEDLKAVIAFVGSLAARPVRPEGDLALGRVVFEIRCVACHGTDGRGDGPSDMRTPRLPANFHSKQPTLRRARSVLAHGVGGTAMVRMDQNMSAGQRDAVVGYVQSLFDGQPSGGASK